MKEFIARENIRRFEAQLAECTDREQQEMLSHLLETERQHLAEALASKRSKAKAS